MGVGRSRRSNARWVGRRLAEVTKGGAKREYRRKEKVHDIFKSRRRLIRWTKKKEKKKGTRSRGRSGEGESDSDSNKGGR